MAASKLQKHRFSTGPVAKEAFYADKAKDDEKRQATEKKTAENEAKAPEIEIGQSWLVPDEKYQFKGSLSSYKTPLTRLGDLPACLALPFTGCTQVELFAAIESHFEANPENKDHPRFASLFLPPGCAGGRCSVQPGAEAPSIPHGNMNGGQQSSAAE